MTLWGVTPGAASDGIVIDGKRCKFKSAAHISRDFGSTKVTHLEKRDKMCVFRVTAEVDGQFSESICKVPLQRKPIIVRDVSPERGEALSTFYDASFDLRNCKTLRSGTVAEERQRYEQQVAVDACEALIGDSMCPEGYMDWMCSNKDLCYREVVKKFSDIRLCMRMNNAVFRRECIEPIALNAKKYDQCLLLSSEDDRPFRNQCLELIVDRKHHIEGVYYTESKGVIIAGQVYYAGDKFDDIFTVKEVRGDRVIFMLSPDDPSEIYLFAK